MYFLYIQQTNLKVNSTRQTRHLVQIILFVIESTRIKDLHSIQHYEILFTQSIFAFLVAHFAWNSSKSLFHSGCC